MTDRREVVVTRWTRVWASRPNRSALEHAATDGASTVRLSVRPGRSRDPEAAYQAMRALADKSGADLDRVR
jgi:hypothetical protein